MNSTYRLVMRTGPTVGKVYPLEKNEISIGRDLSCDVVINDGEISRRHARMALQGTLYTIEDLGSTNGTFINGQRLIGPYSLRPGEVITFGEHITVVYEVTVVDADATVAIPAARPVAPPPQSYETAVAPYPPQKMPEVMPPAPQPLQVEPLPPAPKKKKFPIWVIIILVAVLLIICVCVGVLLYIDSNSLWCNIAPFLFPSACP